MSIFNTTQSVTSCAGLRQEALSPLPTAVALLDKPPSALVRQGGVKILAQRLDHTIVQGSRRLWHFLTLGVPALINALSVFFEGLISREKCGSILRFRFTQKYVAFENSSELQAFHSFNEIAPGLLKKSEEGKALQWLNRLVNRCEEAKASGNYAEAVAAKQEIDLLTNLLEKNKKAFSSRKQLTAEEWAVLDRIDYELTAEFFAGLADFFNTAWFQSLQFHDEMKKAFRTNYHEALVAENLALALAYIEGVDGKLLALPILDKDAKTHRLVNYRIQESTLGDNLPCYILESEDPAAHPWVVVRGTQYYTDISAKGNELRRGSLESILADSIDHKCIARHVINKTLVTKPIFELPDGTKSQRASLGDCFERWYREHKRVNLAGHSLGATLVNNLAVEFYDDVHKAYAFSGAGVSKKIAKRWDLLVEKTQVRANLSPADKDELNAKLVNFDYEGDLIPAGGSRLIGTHLAIKDLAKRQLDKMYQCHVSSHLNNNFEIRRVDSVKENGKLARKFCEQLRVATGRCFRFLLTVFNRKQFPDWWLNRKVYKEAAYHHRIFAKEARRRQG